MSDLIKKVVSVGGETELKRQTVFVEDPCSPATEPAPIPSMSQIAAALADKRETQKRQIKSLRDALARAQEILDSIDV